MPITPIIEPTTSLKNARIGYKNLLTASSNTEAAKMLIPNTFERFVSGPASYTLKFQLSEIAAIDFIAIGAHNAGTHSGGVNILVKYATTIGGALTTIENLEFADNGAKMILFDEIEVAEIALVFSVAVGLELGVIYAGKSLEMQRSIYGGNSPIDLNAKTEYQSTMSDSGQFLGRSIVRQGVKTSFSWQHLTDDWVRNTFMPFVNSAKTTPFFMVWKPELYDQAVFGYTTDDVKLSNMGGGHKLMTASFNMTGHQDT